MACFSWFQSFFINSLCLYYLSSDCFVLPLLMMHLMPYCRTLENALPLFVQFIIVYTPVDLSNICSPTDVTSSHLITLQSLVGNIQYDTPELSDLQILLHWISSSPSINTVYIDIYRYILFSVQSFQVLYIKPIICIQNST